MKVRRANVVLTVTENEINKYLARGYTVYDNSGKIVAKPIPKDVNSLTKAYIEHESEIRALKEKIKELEETQNKKRTNTKAKKSEEQTVEES